MKRARLAILLLVALASLLVISSTALAENGSFVTNVSKIRM